MTPTDFARALLQKLKLPVTDNNVAALVAFQKQEGGHEANSAWFNPLNTMYPVTPSKDFPGAHDAGLKVKGIKAYANWDEGLEATARTLAQGNMKGIFNSLARNASPAETLNQIPASGWGWSQPVAFSAYLLSGANKEYRSVAGALDTFTNAFSSPAVKYGALAFVGLLVVGGVVFAGYKISKRHSGE